MPEMRLRFGHVFLQELPRPLILFDWKLWTCVFYVPSGISWVEVFMAESEDIRKKLKEAECVREGDLVYCREGGQIRIYPIDEARGSLSETSVIAAILGVLGIVLMPLPFIGISSALLAILFGGVALYQTRRGYRRGLRLSMTGLILGILGIIGFILLMARILSLGEGPS